jgi:hypothetical protein
MDGYVRDEIYRILIRKPERKMPLGRLEGGGRWKDNIVTCRVDYRRGFGLDDWIYCSLYIHTTRDYR